VPGRSLDASLADALARKTLPLVLDNCEHLVSACATLAATLLRTCPNLRLLATSREPLRTAGETTYRLSSLLLPSHAPASPQQLAHYDALLLFVERAREVMPGFSATDANVGAIAQVCACLDGIPLAIELAAARVRALSVAQIVERLADRFRLLTGGDRAGPLRQQTLRATLDWSYDLLSDAQQTLFRRLAVFAGGWTLDAAEAVGVGDGIAAAEVLDLLTALVDQSLVVVEQVEREP